MFTNTRLFCLTNEDENHCGFQYKDGLNCDAHYLDPLAYPDGSAMHFYSREGIWKYSDHIGYGSRHWVREVTIPDDAEIQVEHGRRKVDRFVLGARQLFDPHTFFSENFTDDEKVEAVKKDGLAIRYFADTASDAMKLEAVKKTAEAITYFAKSASDEMKLEVARSDPFWIGCFADSATDEMKSIAVQHYGWAIEHFVDSATDEMKIEALKQNGRIIQLFANSATEEMKEIAEANK